MKNYYKKTEDGYIYAGDKSKICKRIVDEKTGTVSLEFKNKQGTHTVLFDSFALQAITGEFPKIKVDNPDESPEVITS